MTGCTKLSITLQGPDDAVLAIGGPVDADTARRAGALLRTALASGVLRIIVDLSAARDVPDELLDELLAISWTVAEQGGWLLVEGEEDADPHAGLLDAFRVYRDTVAA